MRTAVDVFHSIRMPVLTLMALIARPATHVPRNGKWSSVSDTREQTASHHLRTARKALPFRTLISRNFPSRPTKCALAVWLAAKEACTGLPFRHSPPALVLLHVDTAYSSYVFFDLLDILFEYETTQTIIAQAFEALCSLHFTTGYRPLIYCLYLITAILALLFVLQAIC